MPWNKKKLFVLILFLSHHILHSFCRLFFNFRIHSAAALTYAIYYSLYYIYRAFIFRTLAYTIFSCHIHTAGATKREKTRTKARRNWVETKYKNKLLRSWRAEEAHIWCHIKTELENPHTHRQTNTQNIFRMQWQGLHRTIMKPTEIVCLCTCTDKTIFHFSTIKIKQRRIRNNF